MYGQGNTNGAGVATGGEATATLALVDGGEDRVGDVPGDPGCFIQLLPERLLVPAAKVAEAVNPMNAPYREAMLPGGLPVPASLAVLTTKYWGRMARTLTVSFVETTPEDLQRRILSHMNAWNIGVGFVLTKSGGHVRISRGGQGYWSYLGTDVLQIPAGYPTMNLQGFTMNTADSEFVRVVRHETGHTLGFPHEHLRRALIEQLDVAKTITYFRDHYGWSEAQTRSNVLTPLDERSIMATPHADEDSIMCYQLPGAITRNGRPIRGGNDINANDRRFAEAIYPPSVTQSPLYVSASWPASVDVPVDEAIARATMLHS